MTKKCCSVQAIVVALVFLCAAIMSSVFIFHAKQAPVQTNLANNAGMIFPAARDIKPFHLVTADQQKFTYDRLKGHWTLLFFGFTHCASVCPVTMDMLSRAYPDLHKQYPNLQIALVSLDPERDNNSALAAYTKKYHPDFLGVTGKIEELRKLQSQLGVFSAKEAENNASNYQIQHTPSIMLINPNGKWAGILKFGQTPAEFSTAVTESITALSRQS